MTRILISGPPASGKSTLAADLAVRLGCVVIDFDVIAREFGSTGHAHSKEISDRAHLEVAKRIRETLGSAVLVKSAPRREEREQFARDFQADSIYVLTLPAEAAKERASKDARPSWTANAIDKWWSTFEPSEMDTSRSATLTGDLIGIAAMADVNPNPANPSNPAGAAAPQDEALGAPGLKALQAERDRAEALEAALKALQGGGDAVAAASAATKAQRDAETALAKAQAQLQEFEDKGKTEEQKRADKDAKLALERDTATVKALRYEVCEAKDLPLAAARFLTGSTKAEIEEAAEAFKALGVATGKPATGLPPAPNAGRESKRPSGAEQGLAEAERRFGKKS